MLTRRRFSQLLIGVATAGFQIASAVRPALCRFTGAQDMGAALTQSRDLLIKGGTVVDPSQNLHALARRGGERRQDSADRAGYSGGWIAERYFRQRQNRHAGSDRCPRSCFRRSWPHRSERGSILPGPRRNDGGGCRLRGILSRSLDSGNTSSNLRPRGFMRWWTSALAAR